MHLQAELVWSEDLLVRLDDDIHNICATLDISVPEMVVQAAAVEFVRYPLPDCRRVAPQMAGLVGANLFEDYSQRIRQL